MVVLYGVLNLPGVQAFAKDRITLELEKKLQTNLSIGQLHFQPFTTIELKDVKLDDRANKKILRINNLYANIDVWSLVLHNSIVINSIHLSNFEIYLAKEKKDAPLNIQFIIDAFKPEKKGTKSLFQFNKISTVAISNGKFNYDITDQQQKQNSFDANHIHLSDFDARLSVKAFSNDSINIQIKRLNLKEQSGFEIKNLITRIEGNIKNINLKGFRLDLPQSFIKLDKCNIKQYDPSNKNLISRYLLDCKIGSSYIVPSEISTFVPALSNFNQRLLFQTSVNGTIDDLSIEKLSLDYADKMHISATAMINDLRNQDSLFLQGKVDELTITKDGIEGLLNNFSRNKQSIPNQIANLGTVSFHGNISGFLKDLLANGTFNTALGSIVTDLHFGFNTPNNYSSFFKGNISTQDFNLGKLINNKDLNLLTFNMSVDIKKTRNEQLKGNLNGTIEQFDFRGYSYKNIDLDGECDGLMYKGQIAIDDDNGYLFADGLFDLSQNEPMFNFVAQLKNIRLDELHLTDKYKQSYLTSDIKANFSGKDIDNLEGSLSIDSFEFAHDNKSYNLENFTLTSSIEPDYRTLTINSDIINGNITGQYHFSSLLHNLQKTANIYFPALFTQKTDEKPRKGKVEKEDKIVSFEDNFNLHFTIENTEKLSDILSLPVIVFEPVKIDAAYKKSEDKFNLDIDLPSLKAAGSNIKGGYFHADNKGNEIESNIKASILGKNNIVNILNIDIKAANNHIASNINFSNNSTKSIKGKISFTTELARSETDNSLLTQIEINPGELVINDSIWQTNESSILYKNGSLAINNFTISDMKKSHFIKADGTYSINDPSDVLLLTLKDIDLEYVFTTLNIDALQFGGYASGTISASSIEKKPYAKVNLGVKGLQFNKTPLGDLELFSDFDEESKRVNMHGTLMKENREQIALIDGYIDPITQQLSLNFDAEKINVAFLNKYASSLFNNISGEGTGKVHLYGNFSDVTVEGKAFIENGKLGINFLNTTYNFTDTVYMKSDLIYFNNIQLNDEKGNTANVSGLVSHNYFSDFTFQVNMAGENFLLYNATELQNPLFFGQVYASGSGNISGNEKEVDINMRLRTNENTKVRMNFMEESANQYSFVTYKSKNDSTTIDTSDKTEKYIPRKLESESGIGINMNFYIDATPDATVELVMDPVGGDIIRGEGSGTMHFVWGTNSEPMLYGTYTIQRGSYNFTFQKLLERRFVIESGSTVQFTGDPFGAMLDVTAIYRLNANLNDISSTLAENVKQATVPVQCVLSLTGELKHPNVGLDIALPSVDAEIQRQIKNLVSTQDMMNRQIVYLLLMSKFYTPSDARSNNQTSDLASVASATLSSQLSNILSQIDDRWQFGANVRTSDSEFTQTEVELLLSSHLLNNRLIINGNFGYRDNPQTQSALIGDVDIEYLLGKRNTWRIKAYNHFNEKYYYLSPEKPSIQTQGVGIMYKKDFDELKEIFWTEKKIDSLFNLNKDTIVLPDSTTTGSHLGPFIKIKE